MSECYCKHFQLNHIRTSCIYLSRCSRISKFKENLPSCTLNVILFLEQGVEMRTLQHEMHVHPV